MADETAVVPNVDVTETQVTPEEPVIAKPDEGGEVADPQGTETEGETEHERKRKGGWQRQKERAERERDLALEEKEYWRQQALRTPKPEEAQPKPEPVAAKEPTPQDFDLGDGSYDIVKFNKAHVDWLWEQKESQRVAKTQEESAKSEEQKLRESWTEKLAKAREKYDDMDEALTVPVLPNDPKKNAFMQREIMRSEFAGDLAHWLGTHPDEARELGNKSEYEIARAFGRIEAQFAHSESAQPAPKEAVVAPVTRAPKPPTPVAKTSTVKTVDINDPKLPYADFVREREAQLKRK
jgi:hypothetical protein